MSGIGSLISYELDKATVSKCGHKASKTHANVLQIVLADKTEFFVATNTTGNLERWVEKLQNAFGTLTVFPCTLRVQLV